MATLRDIKRSISGVKSTQKITKAMKMVSAARLSKAQENIINSRPYSRKIAEVLSQLLAVEKNYEHPFLVEKGDEKIAIIAVSSDRGLCGAFNNNIISEVERMLKEDYSEQNKNNNLSLICVGKKTNDYFNRHGYNVVQGFNGIFSDLKFDFVAQLNKQLSGKFISSEFDKIIVVYNKFTSVAQQKVTTIQLFPIKPEVSDDTLQEVNIDYIFEPDKKTIIDGLLPQYLNVQLWAVLLDSYAGELGARMTAMDMATENASEMISSLQLSFNKRRQAAITNEILEIVSGANALKGN
ncbi:MAG: ATP synthase F1 subunit gamma [Bacteroidetes bacterium]|nr:ATP synthase F1 subunit gamma [Bacteroidota bacterium]MBU1115980.1 ATP synthase F1 subunit gamma [Bacteroidota bacterium]MBU1798423.1 ATP synthase F1 subunit gamma [Bacteroidota bacterium]